MDGILPKLLIVDDKKANRKALEAPLREAEVELYQAESGPQALEAVLDHEFCLILMDINMPGMDGYATTELITGQFGKYSIPIIFLTAYHNPDAINQCYEAGGIDYLAKPIDIDILLAKVNLFREFYIKQRRIIELKDESEAMMEAAGDGIIGVDSALNIKFANSMASQLLQQSKTCLIGQPLIPYLINASTDAEWEATAISRALKRHQSYQVSDDKIFRETGESFPASYTLSPILAAGDIAGGVLVFKDISEQKRVADKIAHFAQYDQLTSLYNRMMFYSMLNQSINSSVRYCSKMAVHFIDLDHFKDVNDTLGHNTGDEVIIEAARRLNHCMRDSDTVARLGGDEFGVIQLLKDEDSISAAVLAERIIDAFQASFSIAGKEVFIGCSVGIALYPDHAEDAQELVKAADTAMYQSKDAGRNQYHFYSSALQQQVAEHMAMVSALKQALDHDEITIEYQPQIDTATQTIHGVEALMRWRSPELGMVSPAVFIPIAEQVGLISRLGQWILETACTQVSQWLAQGIDIPKLHLAVNVSVNQMKQGDFSTLVASVLEKTQLPPHQLKLEITEGVLMNDPRIVIEEIGKINLLGIDLAIDDFGTGYSSLSYLGLLPLKYLKIDRVFITDIDNNTAHQKIVLSILRLAESLGYEVIAEGVETEAELNYLTALGCHIIQGFYFSKPLPADKVVHFVESFSENAATLFPEPLGERLNSNNQSPILPPDLSI